MIAASIPTIVPVLRWIGEKLSGYRKAIALWTALNKKTETADYGGSFQPGQRSSKKISDTQSGEYILPTYALGSGKDFKAVEFDRGSHFEKTDLECEDGPKREGTFVR